MKHKLSISLDKKLVKYLDGNAHRLGLNRSQYLQLILTNCRDSRECRIRWLTDYPTPENHPKRRATDQGKGEREEEGENGPSHPTDSRKQ